MMKKILNGVVKEAKERKIEKLALFIIVAISSIGLLFFGIPTSMGSKIFVLLSLYSVIVITLRILYSGVNLISTVLICFLAISSLLFFHIIPYNQQLYDINKLQYAENQTEINNLMVNIKTRQDNIWLFDIPRFDNDEGRKP